MYIVHVTISTYSRIQPLPSPTFLWQYSSFGMSVGSARGGIQADPIADGKRGQKPVPCWLSSPLQFVCDFALDISLLWVLHRSSDHRVHRVETAAFWRTFSDEGKISPGWWGWGVHAHPLSLHLPSPVKLQCTLQLSGQIHWPCFISTNICTLCFRQYVGGERGFLNDF